MIEIREPDHLLEGARATQAIELSLPMAHPYRDGAFFVREWYPRFYEWVLECLNTEADYVTVTGTPGIGKSIFYLYFVHRFRSENPDTPIVTASFEKNRKLTGCWIYDPILGEKETEQIPVKPTALYLYDGAPDRLPPQRAKLVCFCSPNQEWFTHVLKYAQIHLYMPPWTLEELLNANQVLQLGLRTETIVARFRIFGGSARWCLNKSVNAVVTMEGFLKSKSGEISTVDKLRSCFENHSNKADISHNVFHFKPLIKKKYPYATSYNFEFASRRVEKWVKNAIADFSFHTLTTNLRFFAVLPREYMKLRGFLFENYVRAVLAEGGRFRLRNADSPTKVRMVNFRKNKFVPMPKLNATAIDGLYLNRTTMSLYLFQATLADRHPIDGEGIIEHIKSLGLAPKDVKLHLVFVVSKGKSGFKRQTIAFQDRSQKLKANVSSVCGIGPVRTHDLATFGILNVGQLIRGIASETSLRPYQRLVDRFLTQLPQEEKRIICEMPQFVLETQLDFRQSIHDRNIPMMD